MYQPCHLEDRKNMHKPFEIKKRKFEINGKSNPPTNEKHNTS